MVKVSGDKKALSTVTAEMCHIQPISRDKSGVADGVYGKTFKIFLEADTQVQEGDRLRDIDGNYYTVVSGGMTRRTHGSFDYYECIIMQTKS
ncbi:MAG: hypothetical protein FE038_02060 [Thermoplasmata archaeon]|nr:MAG: hypothetical protein FE038_02060 [Thermoplasmata archaeon]